MIITHDGGRDLFAKYALNKTPSWTIQ